MSDDEMSNRTESSPTTDATKSRRRHAAGHLKWLGVAGLVWSGAAGCDGTVSESDPSGSGGAEDSGSGGANPEGTGGVRPDEGTGGVIPSGGTWSGGEPAGGSVGFGGSGLGGGSEGGIGGELARDPVCSQPPFENGNGAGGSCGANFQRYTYDSESGTCEFFYYYGCWGNDNNFPTLQQCEAACVRD